MNFIPNMEMVQFKNKLSKGAYKLKYSEPDGTTVEFPLGYLMFSGLSEKCAMFSDASATAYLVCIRPPLDDSSDDNVVTVKNFLTKEIVLNEKPNPVILEESTGGKRRKRRGSKKTRKTMKRKGRKMTRRHRKR